MSERYDSVIIGGGIFGCLVALELSYLKRKVIILEQNSSLMIGATLNNQNRLHLGYHYPRDLNTALQCQKGFKQFIKDYSECILSGIDNFYLISRENSKVFFKKYELFCKSAELPFNKFNFNKLPEKIFNTSLAINTSEVLYDCKILAKDGSVLERVISEVPPKEWKNPKKIVTNEIVNDKYNSIIRKISSWLPSIKNSELVDYLSTTRMVFPNVETTDERPSIISKLPLNNPFYNVFSGKIDHSIWVSKDIAKSLDNELTP